MAKKMIAGFLEDSINEARESGTFDRPLDYGYFLLEQEKKSKEGR